MDNKQNDSLASRPVDPMEAVRQEGMKAMQKDSEETATPKVTLMVDGQEMTDIAEIVKYIDENRESLLATATEEPEETVMEDEE